MWPYAADLNNDNEGCLYVDKHGGSLHTALIEFILVLMSLTQVLHYSQSKTHFHIFTK